MIFTPIFIGLLPLVAAGRTHKLKLHKVPPTSASPALESAYLAEKYGAAQPQQSPLMGAGGSGRRINHLGEPLFWTQEEIQGGHKVPLTSTLTTLFAEINIGLTAEQTS